MEDNKKKLIIIPAYNEEKNIAVVLNEIKLNFPKTDITVIDDGSEDKTAVIAQSMGVNVIELFFNMGIGAAVQTGLKFAKIKNYDYVIRIDADGQHPAGEAKKLINKLCSESLDAVTGSRYFNNSVYKGNIARKLATRMLSKIVSFITGKRFSDVTSGIMCLNKKAVEFLSENYPEDYPETESVILLCKNGFKIEEIPVNMELRKSGVSSISIIKSVYYMIRVILALFIFSFKIKKLSVKK